MKWLWKHKIFNIFIPLSLVVLGYIIWFAFIFTGTYDDQYGKYIFRYDYYGDSVFEYELLDDSNIYNYTYIHALVHDYVKKGDSIFFTYINGTFNEGFCYYEKKLYLGKIDLKSNKLENNININLYPKIYKKLSDLTPTERKWLNASFNKCPENN
ncbi:hypothetical protein [Snodgrassella communis]|uniref:hypothetical protein n=1 Tax=Snodgrassella communis TaxID=2946699 RepID=UPI0005683BBA|nr:hypothetical protein [Snodgrassella communis]